MSAILIESRHWRLVISGFCEPRWISSNISVLRAWQSERGVHLAPSLLGPAHDYDEEPWVTVIGWGSVAEFSQALRLEGTT